MNRSQHRHIAEDLQASLTRIRERIVAIEHCDLDALVADTDAAEARVSLAHAELEEGLGSLLSSLGGRLLVYTEALELPATRARVSEWLERWTADTIGSTKTWSSQEAEGRESPAFGEIASLIDGLLVLLTSGRGDSTERRDHMRLSHCLASLARICHERGVVPKRELDVQGVMHSHLAGVFPDYVQRVRLPKPLVSFEPDGGIPSLRAAIECKFIDDEREIATAIRGITEDLSGYAGSKDWTRFYSIIYMTGPYVTQGQVERSLAASGNARAWTTILVTGPGGRFRKRERVRKQ